MLIKEREKERDNGVIVVTSFISAQDDKLLTISLCPGEESTREYKRTILTVCTLEVTSIGGHVL